MPGNDADGGGGEEAEKKQRTTWSSGLEGRVG